ncbi:sigma-70 family RNA polymerase sigma factor [bacterium]|nr:sigma-70 family RNA polymerase sigma factor [bacterium]
MNERAPDGQEGFQMGGAAVQTAQDGLSARSADENRSESSPAEWLQEHGDYLYRYAFSRMNSPEVAEDLVQETLLAGVRGYKNFEGRSSIRTWLVGILKNKIIDHLRRVSRKERKEVLEEDNDTLDRHFNRFGIWNRVLPNWASEPTEIFERKEFLAAFECCLGQVPEKARRAFMLKTFENIGSEEICKILDITSSNLWVLLHRCRLSLRECLEGRWLDLREQEKDE